MKASLSFRTVVAALLLCASSGVSTQSTQTHSIVSWGATPPNIYGPTVAIGRAISVSGEIAGAVSFAGQEEDPRAFLWQDGAMTDLPGLGGTYSGAQAINPSRLVAGYASTTGDAAFHAVLWENAVIRDLGTLGGTGSAALGINASGQVVGYASTVNNAGRHAFLWEEARGMTDLGTFGGSSSAAFGINDSGQVVGDAQRSDGAGHAFLWQGGVMRDLGTLGGLHSRATAINVSGQVVGNAARTDGASHAFLWQDGVMRDLGTLGGVRSDATAINASGQVLGHAQTSGNAIVPFLWQHGVMTDLNAMLPPGSGWVLREATAINDSGQIIGWGDFNRQRRPFLLTLVVERPPDSLIAVPGRIEAEHYDQGGPGVAYTDLTPGNSGGAYRADDVDLESVQGSNTNFNVGWMSAGEWLEYTIDVSKADTYVIEARVASSGDGGTFHVEAAGIRSGSIKVPDTGGWQQWHTVTTTLTLAAGVQHLRVAFDTNGVSGAVGNLDYLQLTNSAGSSPTTVTFTVEAADFATGGQGCWRGPFDCGGGYYDETPGNWGDAQVRPGTDVDLWYDDGGIVIGGLDGLEWVTFPVTVPQSGHYTVRFRTASPMDRPSGSGVINVGIHGVDGSWVENQRVPITAGPGEWHTYVSWNAPNTIYLPAGSQTLTMWAAGGWYNVRNMQFTRDPGSGGIPLPLPPPGSMTFEITGVVTDEAGSPVIGATVHIWDNYEILSATLTDVSGRYQMSFTGTPGSNHYGSLDPAGTEGSVGFVEVGAAGYEYDSRHVIGTTPHLVENIRLQPIRRIHAGESSVLTMTRETSVCVIDAWPGRELVCGHMRVVVPIAGMLTVEVNPTQAGADLPRLEGCGLAYGNPSSLQVTAQTECHVRVQLPWGFDGTRSFVVKTSLKPPD